MSSKKTEHAEINCPPERVANHSARLIRRFATAAASVLILVVAIGWFTHGIEVVSMGTMIFVTLMVFAWIFRFVVREGEWRQAEQAQRITELHAATQAADQANTDLLRMQDDLAQLVVARELAFKQEARLRRVNQSILDAVGEGVIGLDGQGRVIFANPRAVQLLGWAENDLLGQVADVFVAPSNGEEALGDLYSATGDRVLRRKNGTVFPATCVTKDVVEGELAEGIVLTFDDVSERRAAEAALRAEKEAQERLLRRLEEAQNQLLQSEKMASIGQLAAGVAHEINNPVGYVKSNLGTLRGYLEQVMALLAAYGAVENKDAPAEARHALDRLKATADLPFLRDDIWNLLRECEEGLARVAQIVRDLKDFSHVDGGEHTKADIHRGLDSTINIVWNELKYKAKVVREYGELPLVDCAMAQINQVFMNLLVNAAQAIDQQGTIWVRTGLGEAGWVWAEVEDTGQGILPENLKKIFDPFFTTKPVGKGTGLGLSLAYGIVKKHGGRIEVDSTVGKGTRFRVWLPVCMPEQGVDSHDIVPRYEHGKG